MQVTNVVLSLVDFFNGLLAERAQQLRIALRVEEDRVEHNAVVRAGAFFSFDLADFMLSALTSQNLRQALLMDVAKRRG